MVSTYQIGTAPDQIPTNADLGEMAFQSKDNVNFTGGTGKLSKLDIEAVSKQLNVSAVSIFVYDTSKDSDGGAWRKRCQNLSWYNEPLNTTTRGSRREFPSVAVIVYLEDQAIIYDGDDVSLPMWMVFNAGAPGASNLMGHTGRISTAVAALNAEILFCSRNSQDQSYISLLKDYGFMKYDSSSVDMYKGNIAQRNSGLSYYGASDPRMSGAIASRDVHDVAMTVLPSAPVDADTRLPVPTIAMATQGGVSVIKDNGVVVNITTTNWAFCYGVDIKDNILYAQQGYYYWFAVPLEGLTNYSGLADRYATSPFWNVVPAGSYQVNFSQHGAACSGASYTFASDVNPSANGKTNFIQLSSTSLGSANNGMVVNLSSKYNSGWLVGNIKGAWLCDTTQSPLIKTELITNGDFSNSTNGWTAATSGSLSVTSGVMRVTNGGTNGRAVSATFNTVPGRQYQVKATGISKTTSNYYMEVRGPEVQKTWSSGTIQFTFTAIANTTYVELYAIGSAGTYSEYDDVSVTDGEADRSINGSGLEVFGSVDRTPVAAGADLVGYDWTNGYFVQPYNSGWDFGTGDFSFAYWAKMTTLGTYNEFLDIAEYGTNNNRCEWLVLSDGSIRLYMAGTTVDTAASAFPLNQWNFVVCTRKSGIVYHYVNGVYITSGTAAADIANANSKLWIGANYNGSNRNGWGALMRISSTPLTAEQIVKIYNDEKMLFQDNAKATLYGTSIAVTAMAFDEDTKLLHVGTSSGRSVFQGLCRIDNTTTAVSTAISAANGLVAEQ